VAHNPRSADRAGSKATIHEVARRARVSITTVSRTINTPSLVDPKTARRVWKAIDELNYYPDVHARSLVSGKSNILGLIVSDITNPFFPDLVKGFEDVVVQHGYEVMVSSTNYDPARMALCVRRMIERQVEGVAIMTSEMEEHLVEQLVSRRVPTVFLDVGTPGEGISNIVVEYAHGIDEAVQYLAGLGHRKIGFVSGPETLASARTRRTAFIEAIASHGLVHKDEWIGQGDHKVTGGVRAMNELLRLADRPTAVLASNDLTAIGMMSAIRKAGLSVPKDISVVGFDDIWLAEFTEPPLTTVLFPRDQVAEQACRALMSHLGNSAQGEQLFEYRVETHLIVRESTARV
jgi:LacI family transcriptional regulator